MDLKDQRFGIEIEMTGVTRQMAAEVTANTLAHQSVILGLIIIPMPRLTVRGVSGNL